MGRNFLRCGVTGWCLEVMWTGLHGGSKNKKRMGQTSLIMFPIYGLACLMSPLCEKIKHWNVMIRGTVYTMLIFATEFVTGISLKKRNICPWDYSKCKFQVKGVIRLDYAPAWFFTGLLFEKIMRK